MSFHVFFDFSTGLSKTVRVRQGTLEDIRSRVKHTEKVLKLETEQYRDNAPHWTSNSLECASIDDAVLCEAAEFHNDDVRWFYDMLLEGDSLPDNCNTEEITPEQAAEFWHGLQMIYVPPERWTAEYYIARMESVYATLRGHKSEGVTLDADPLTIEQADAVITVFSKWLDKADVRLAVCKGYDELSVSGAYEWCPRCGAIDSEEFYAGQDEDDEHLDTCPHCNKSVNS